MFDAQTIITVKATIPLPVETRPELTAYFYDHTSTHNPELKEIFNMSSQRDGDQREVLSNAIVVYASSTKNLPALLPAVEKIVQKHTSFQIKSEQYNIVGEHLLATLDEMFSPGQEVLDARDKAYDVLANVFINCEAEIYNEDASKAGGWEGIRDFRIMAKTPRDASIISFELESVDGGAVAEYRPGQYPGVWLKPENSPHQEIRQYSLACKPDGKGYCITVKREEGGQIPNWLYSHTNASDVVKLAAPAGDFFMAAADDIPTTLASAGVGQTPMLAVFDMLTKAGHTVQVNWFRAAENGDVHAFVDEVKELGQSLPRLITYTWYRQPSKVDRTKDQLDSEGLTDLSKLEGAFGDPTMRFYLCGPVDFMQFTAKQLVDLGVEQENIHYEYLGPHKVL